MSQKETFLLPDGRKTSDLKVAELKKELEKLGKSKSGNKSDLLNRLNESFGEIINNDNQIEKENSVSSESQNEVASRVVNLKNSYNNNVDLDASDDAQPDNSEINQSVDALDLYVPMDDSLNIADESIQEERIQVTISRNEDVDSSCDSRRVIETVTSDVRTVICDNNEFSEKDECIDMMECNVDDDQDINKLVRHVETTLKESVIDGETIENEVDEMENIELETQIEMYEVDNIDLDGGQMEMYDDHKDEQGKDVKKDDLSTEESITITVNQKDDDCSNLLQQDTGSALAGGDETEEGEVVSVPITARLGKRKVVKDEKKSSHHESHTSSPKKSKKKGLKETKGAGYIVEGPQRIQPAQKSKNNIVSDVLRVDNLVRPFTLLQLQDMLATQGIVKDVWLNKIKSVAYVQYESETIAISARENIDGCRWPSINPKLLVCDFVFLKEMEWMKEKGDSGVNPPQNFKPQAEQQVKPIVENEWRSVDKSKPANRDNYKSEKTEDVKKRLKEREVPENKRRRSPNGEHRRRHESPKERIREPRERDQREQKDREQREKERIRENVREKSKEKPPPAAKLLEDIFRKTVTQPAIYWLPVSKEKKEEIIKKIKEPVKVV